jgi:hypothetical protein
MERMEDDPVPALVKAAAWDAQRPTITHLYIDQGKKLKEVMSIMEREHQFFGT